MLDLRLRVTGARLSTGLTQKDKKRPNMTS